MWTKPLLVAALAYFKAHAFSSRMLDACWRCVAGLLCEALTGQEKTYLTIHIYNASHDHGETQLAPWECSWFRRRLPPPPARILLGACGAGRESVALVREGFQVHAFDPAPQLTARCRERHGDGTPILTFDYEEFSASVLESARGAASHFARERYDAAILGWGSLTHVLDAVQRVRLLRALVKTCPTGPILASFWTPDQPPRPKPTLGRAGRCGRALGHKLAALRGLDTQTSARQDFAMHRGFAHSYTCEEIEELAASVGWEVIWEEQDDTTYPHVTFLRPATSK